MQKTFGEIIKELREESELTQSKLAEKLQTTQRKISYIECNKYEPSIDDIRAFCKFFNVSADYLLGLKTNKPHKRLF